MNKKKAAPESLTTYRFERWSLSHVLFLIISEPIGQISLIFEESETMEVPFEQVPPALGRLDEFCGEHLLFGSQWAAKAAELLLLLCQALEKKT